MAGIDITCGRAAMEVRDGAGRPRLSCSLALPVRFNGVCETPAWTFERACCRLLDVAAACGVGMAYAVCDERAVMAVDARLRPVSDVVWEADARAVGERDGLLRTSFRLINRRPTATNELCKTLWMAKNLSEVFTHTAAFVSPARYAAQLARERGLDAAAGDRYGAAATLLRLMPEVAAIAGDRLMIHSEAARCGLFDADAFNGAWRLTAQLPESGARERAFFIRARLEETGGVRQVNAAADAELCRMLADTADMTVLRTDAAACLTGAAMLAAGAAGIDTGGITPEFTEEYAPECPSLWDAPYIDYCVSHADFAKSLYL